MGTVSWLCSSSLVKGWVKAAVVCITHRFHHCFSTWSQRYLSLSLLPQRHWLPRDLRNHRGLSALGFTYCVWPITKHVPLSQSTLVGSNHNAEREDKLCAKTLWHLTLNLASVGKLCQRLSLLLKKEKGGGGFCNGNSSRFSDHPCALCVCKQCPQCVNDSDPSSRLFSYGNSKIYALVFLCTPPPPCQYLYIYLFL